jgi:hypothetical protein
MATKKATPSVDPDAARPPEPAFTPCPHCQALLLVRTWVMAQSARAKTEDQPAREAVPGHWKRSAVPITACLGEEHVLQACQAQQQKDAA